MSYTHLSYDERLIIAAYLEYADIKRITIANALKRDPKTITLEILKHRYLSIRKNQRNKCGRQNDCIVTRLCEDCAYGQCKFCRHDNCNQICGLFSEFSHFKKGLPGLQAVLDKIQLFLLQGIKIVFQLLVYCRSSAEDIAVSNLCFIGFYQFIDNLLCLILGKISIITS